MRDGFPHDWHFSAASASQDVVEQAERVFLSRNSSDKYETQIRRPRKGGLWIFEYREKKEPR